MGFALANQMAENDAKVILITGPVHLSISHPNITRINIVSAEEMYQSCVNVFLSCDIAIMCAAVADYRPLNPSPEKIKKTDSEQLVIHLERNRDILAELGSLKNTHQILGGFSLETHNEENFALDKLKRKNCDFIVLNSLKDEGAGFGADTNKVSIYSKGGTIEHFALKSKENVAKDIVAFIQNNF